MKEELMPMLELFCSNLHKFQFDKAKEAIVGIFFKRL